MWTDVVLSDGSAHYLAPGALLGRCDWTCVCQPGTGGADGIAKQPCINSETGLARCQ